MELLSRCERILRFQKKIRSLDCGCDNLRGGRVLPPRSLLRRRPGINHEADSNDHRKFGGMRPKHQDTKSYLGSDNSAGSNKTTFSAVRVSPGSPLGIWKWLDSAGQPQTYFYGSHHAHDVCSSSSNSTCSPVPKDKCRCDVPSAGGRGNISRHAAQQRQN